LSTELVGVQLFTIQGDAVESRTGVPRRIVRQFLVAALLVCAFAAAHASQASANIYGHFCWELWLGSGDSCHSIEVHSFFREIGAASNYEYPTCVGVDVSRTGGNLVNACSSSYEVCVSACSGYSGYAYDHNHGQIGDYYYAELVAAS
jgi:hypothetical protein